jgi:F0F1-type ATP synthase assembly protein I
VALFGQPPKRKKDVNLGATSLLLAVPAIMLVAPLIGFFLGRWADGKFDTEPYLTVIGLGLGFGAAAREIYFLVKKAQSMEDKEDDN